MYVVNLFGRFQLINEKAILNEDSIHSEMLIKLLAYLITHREHIISAQELTEALWQNDETYNPVGALKNLMYRLRTTLKRTFGEEEFIRTNHGGYSWNSNLQLIVDVEEFEKKCIEAKRKKGLEQIKVLEDACILYQGQLLSNYGYVHWVIPLGSYYQSMFLNCAKFLATAYEAGKRYDDMERICTVTLKLEPSDEEVHVYMIKALIYQNKIQSAIQYYEKAKKILEELLGIHNSIHLQEIHKELMKVKNSSKVSKMEDICQEVLENNQLGGAYICAYSVFREICRIEARRTKRKASQQYIILFTLLSKEELSETNEKLMKYKMSRFMEIMSQIMRNSLRMGDVITRYSETQYMVLIPSECYEDAMMVTNRILLNLYASMNTRKMKIKTDIEEMSMDLFLTDKIPVVNLL